MANPNPEIWGAPETWQNNFILGGTTTAGAENLKASKAKVAKWDVEGWSIGTSQLRAAVMNNKITPNERIDKSICPCGQDIRASHLNQIGVFVNRNLTEYPDDTDVQYITLINGLGHSGAPINWCFFECRRPGSGASAYFQNGYQLDMSNTRYPYTVWYPDADFDSSVSSKQNGNYYVAPLLNYQSRSILLRIVVDYIDTTYADGSPHGTITVPLEEWKNSYSDKKICRIGLRIFKVYSLALSSITYNAPTTNTYDFSGAMLLDTINVGTTNYDLQPSFEHFGFMGMGQTGYISLLPLLELSNQRQSNEYIYGFMPCMNYFSGAELKSVRRSSSNSNSGRVWQEIPYSADTYDKIMSMAALFGCPFTPTSKLSFNNAFTDADLCLPIIDDNGITHGEYTRGSGNTDNPFINLDNVRDKDYKPDAHVDTNTYSNVTGFNSISAGASATERYVLDAGNTRQLLSDLWTISHNIAGVDYDNYNYKILDSFLVSNPIDSIISLKRFPFNIPHTFSNTKTPVNLGKNHGSAQGYLTYNAFNSVQFEGIDIFPRFGDSFLDYAPYTEYELYVPFCGTVKLNAGDILGHTLNCRLQIDLITGACTAYIMADSLVIETMTGTVSCELALTGIDSATIDANIQNSVLNHVNARTNKEVSMLSPMTVGGLIGTASNPFKTAGSIANAKTETQRAEYELTHIQTPPHTMGSAGGLTGWCQEFNARLLIYYPEGDVITNSIPPELTNLANYGHTTGFATIDNTLLSSYSGFTVATNAILKFAATDTEKEMILNLLQSGVFL